MTVHFAPGHPEPGRAGHPVGTNGPEARWWRGSWGSRSPRVLTGLVVGLGLALALTAALAPFRSSVSRASPALVLVVPVVVAGILGGRISAVVTAVVGGASFDVTFLPPVGGISVAVSGDVVGLVVFLIVAILVGTLAADQAARRHAAEQRSIELQVAHTELARVSAERARLVEEHGRLEVLERVDEQRSALLRSVSHDLRTPLAAIRAAATDLGDDAGWTPGQRDQLLGVIGSQAQRLDRLVANLLSMGRIEAGALRPALRSVDLGELLTDTVVPLRTLFAPARVELVTEGPLPPVWADYVQIEQVVTNLVENAVRHGPKGGTVTITATGEDGSTRVTVADQGPGIAPGQEAVIFEPFRTGGASTSTGVGLAICRGIVDAHGGRIGVLASDVGARLSFSLPAADGGQDSPARDLADAPG
jgi:K+-sensing histidine kinase KdpD